MRSHSIQINGGKPNSMFSPSAGGPFERLLLQITTWTSARCNTLPEEGEFKHNAHVAGATSITPAVTFPIRLMAVVVRKRLSGSECHSKPNDGLAKAAYLSLGVIECTPHISQGHCVVGCMCGPLHTLSPSPLGRLLCCPWRPDSIIRIGPEPLGLGLGESSQASGPKRIGIGWNRA